MLEPYYMERKQGVVKPLLITVLLTVIVIEFLFLSVFYDLEFNFAVCQPAPEFEFYSTLPPYQSPAALILLKHECFLARVEIHVFTHLDSEIIISLLNGSVIHLTGNVTSETHYVFINVLPGKFPPIMAKAGAWSIDGHDISTDKPIEVFLEKTDLVNRYKDDPPNNTFTTFILANITVVSGFASVTVKVWGVVL